MINNVHRRVFETHDIPAKFMAPCKIVGETCFQSEEYLFTHYLNTIIHQSTLVVFSLVFSIKYFKFFLGFSEFQ